MKNKTLISDSSRRSFFTKSAMLFGGTALVSQLNLNAQTTGTGTGTGTPTDLDVLQYALSLENLEAAFYNAGVARFASTDFMNSTSAQVFGTKVTSNLFTYLTAIRDHENTHVATLSTVIKSLGGTPNPACTYNFGYATADDFLKVAMALENTGVSAYDGAIALLTNPDLIQAAATIATVEARHASYLNLVNGSIPFPNAFDMPMTMTQVLAIASQFITACAAPTTPPATGSGPSANGTQAAISPATVTTNSRDVQLDATGSKSGSGINAFGFSLLQVSGGAAAIIGGNTGSPLVRILGPAGTYVFMETVTDTQGQKSSATVTIKFTGV